MATSNDTKKATAGKGRVFSVSNKKGPIETVYRSVAIEDCTGKGSSFTAETVEQMLNDGDVVFSDDFYYATTREALSKWEKDAPAKEDAPAKTEAPTETEAPAEAKPFENGDVVKHIKKGIFGEVSIEKKKDPVVLYQTETKKGPTDHIDTDLSKWTLATPDEFFAYQEKKETGIVKASDTPAPAEAGDAPEGEAIEGEIVSVEPVKPLTKKELARLEKLESEFDKVDGLEKAIPFEKGRILNEIRTNKLYRESAATFGEYALNRFGITREYAQNLAQISGIPELAAGVVDDGTEVAMSVNAANEIMRDANRFTKSLGLGKAEFDAVSPVIRNTLAIMVDVAPRNEVTGEIEITPRFVNSFNEVLANHLTDGVVEIDGKQMTVRAASEKGLLNTSLRSEVLESTAESIRTNAATIRSEFEKAKERQETGVTGAGGSGGSDDETQYYKGKVPTLDIVCTKHKDTEIMQIGTGKILTRCGCRWHIDHESGELVAYEVNELPVKRR